MARHRGGRPAQDGPREFTIRTSFGRLRVAECGLCGILTTGRRAATPHSLP
jgi:hypothetical protein